jgi:hypothetical protein
MRVLPFTHQVALLDTLDFSAIYPAARQAVATATVPAPTSARARLVGVVRPAPTVSAATTIWRTTSHIACQGSASFLATMADAPRATLALATLDGRAINAMSVCLFDMLAVLHDPP